MARMRYFIFVGLLCTVVCTAACTDDTDGNPVQTLDAGVGADGTVDGDADTDGDADADADGDADTDADNDADSDADNDTDTDTDTDTDSDADSSCRYECQDHCFSLGGEEKEGDCPDGQKCCDMGDGADGDTDTDSDGDTDADSDGDSDSDADSDADGDPPAATSENTGADCDVSAGELKKNNNLPNPFEMNDGTIISTMDEWRCRRNEIIKDMEKYEIGPKPEPPNVDASYSGGKLNVTVTTDAGSITLSSSVSGSGPCVVIGMNGNSGMVGDCIQVPFMHDQVVKYSMGGGGSSQSDPFYQVYPDLWKVGDYAAWSWGISRIIDGIEQVAEEIGADTSKIAIHGCSYAGKMALFGGAFDERVALTIAQESGGGGIVSWRLAQDFTDRTGTNVEKIDNTSGTWFMNSMKSLDPYSLPHDHHELIAMIAPRAVIALGNPPYEWLGDESGYKSMMAAKQVWKAMGLEDRIGFDFAGGHAHCQASSSQSAAVSAFVDKFLKGNDTDTNIAAEPNQSGFQLNWEDAVDWSTPTLN